MKTFLKHLLMIVLACIGGFGFPFGQACAEDSVIRVGSEIEFPPFAVVDKDGHASGFSIDLIRAVAESIGISIVITTGTWDKMWNGLISGELDVLPIVAMSPERKQKVDFSLAHTETFDAFFVREDDPPIPDLEAADGKEIVVMRSDAAHHALLEHGFQGEIVPVDTIPEGLMMVASGKHDAFLCSKLIGTLAIRHHDIGNLQGGPIIPDYKRVFGFGVKKGNDELREMLNQGLLIVKSNGRYNRIYEKWLSMDDPWFKHRRKLLIVLFATMAVALAAMILSVFLKFMVNRRTRELKKTQEELLVKERLAVLGHFAGSISHELRNPLAAVDASVYYLNMTLGGRDDKTAVHLSRIRSNVKKSTDIIQSLLNLSRMEKPKTMRKDLTDLISEALRSAKIPDPIEVRFDPPEKPVFVDIDPEQIRMALKNIIRNALQAMDESGTLTIAVGGLEAGQVVLSVTDTGPGIAPEHLEKVFDPLFSTKVHGIGFGLSITKMIIENHGGTVRAESASDAGSRFVISLPPG